MSTGAGKALETVGLVEYGRRPGPPSLEATELQRLVAAAEPLEGRFNGAGKIAFDNFKANADSISANLNSALSSILQGQGGMDTAFVTGEQEMVDTTRSTQGAADFGAATF